MSYHRSVGDGFPTLMLILGAFLLFVLWIWKISGQVNLDFDTILKVFIRLILVIVVLIASWWASNQLDIDKIRLGNTWPLFLAAFWWCLWPALDYWSLPFHVPTNVLSYQDFEEHTSLHPDWRGAWYTKWGIFFGLIGLGYFAKKIFRIFSDRY